MTSSTSTSATRPTRAPPAASTRPNTSFGASDFLVCTTPGVGKTWLARTLAKRLLHARAVHRVVVVVPTEALRRQ